MSSEEKTDDVYEKLSKVVYKKSAEGYFRHAVPIISQVNKCTKELRRMVMGEVLLSRDIPRIEHAELSDVSHATLSRWAREAGAVRSRR